MIQLFVQNIGSSIAPVINFFTPFIQYMFVNPVIGFAFISFVIMGFVSVLLHIKNIIKEGVKS